MTNPGKCQQTIIAQDYTAICLRDPDNLIHRDPNEPFFHLFHVGPTGASPAVEPVSGVPA